MCLARLSVVTTASTAGRVRARGALTPHRADGAQDLPMADVGAVRRVARCPLNASYAALASAREFVRHVLADWGSQADQAELSDDVSLVASEMVANALQHGVGLDPPQVAAATDVRPSGAEPDEQVGLTLLATPSALLCVVSDPSSAAPVPRLPDPGTVSGRGLHLIESLSESWGWSPAGEGDRAGKAVWAVFPLAGGDAPAARAGPATFRHTPGAWAFGSVVRRSERKGGGSWGCAGVATPSNTARSSTRSARSGTPG